MQWCEDKLNKKAVHFRLPFIFDERSGKGGGEGGEGHYYFTLPHFLPTGNICRSPRIVPAFVNKDGESSLRRIN